MFRRLSVRLWSDTFRSRVCYSSEIINGDRIAQGSQRGRRIRDLVRTFKSILVALHEWTPCTVRTAGTSLYNS